MSTQMKQQYGLQIGTAIAGAVGVGATAQSIGQWALSQQFNFKNLKYSRSHESEADHLGLIFAAMAGYDPQVAVPFWQRMAAKNGNSQQNDLYSDHPSDATRIKQIQEWMPEALRYYTPPTTTTTTAKKSTPARDEKGRFVKKADTEKATKKTTPARDEKGRFIKKADTEKKTTAKKTKKAA
jgi:predicted Zn-dependent protease